MSPGSDFRLKKCEVSSPKTNLVAGWLKSETVPVRGATSHAISLVLWTAWASFAAGGRILCI